MPGGTFLEVDCGTGWHSVEPFRRGSRCTGIDQSPDMLCQAPRGSWNTVSAQIAGCGKR